MACRSFLEGVNKNKKKNKKTHTIDQTVCPHLKKITTESFSFSSSSSSQISTREPHSVQRSENTEWPSSTLLPMSEDLIWMGSFHSTETESFVDFFICVWLFQKFELLLVQLETCWHESHIESLQWERSHSSRGQELFFPQQTCSSWA